MAVWRPYVIMAALMASIVIYAALVFMVPATSGPDAGLLEILEYALAGIAAATAAAVYLWPQLTGPAAPQAGMGRLIFRAALAESIAIYGLVLHFLGAPFTHALGFIAASLVVLGVVASELPALGQATRKWFVEHHEREV